MWAKLQQLITYLKDLWVKGFNNFDNYRDYRKIAQRYQSGPMALAIINGIVLFSSYFFFYNSDFTEVDDRLVCSYNFVPIAGDYIFFYGFICLFIICLWSNMRIPAKECLVIYLVLSYATIKKFLDTIKIFKDNNLVSIDNWFFSVSIASLNVKIALLVLVGLVLVFMYFLNHRDNEISFDGSFFLIIMLFLLGSFIFLSANNLIVFFFGLELQSLCFYILCSLKRSSNKSLEAGLKYFLWGSFSSFLFAFGLILIYGATGIAVFSDLYLLVTALEMKGLDFLLFHLGLVCLMAGFSFKLAVFPFHWWLADIYEGSADLVTFFLAIASKLPFFYIFSQLYINLYSQFLIYPYLLLIGGICSIVIGSLLALYEIRIKKLIAYSSIVHMGFMMISLSVATPLALMVSFYYFFIYLCMTINFFSIYLILRLANNSTFGNITDLVHLKASEPFLAYLTTVSLLSLAGIPPLLGFYGKLNIFYLLITSGDYFLCMFLVLWSILSALYYLRLIRFIFFDERNYQPMVFFQNISIYLYMLLVFFLFFTIGFLFFQEPIFLHFFSLFT